ncbi:CPBP family intramembrane metalloprotease [Candidatus Micrarchaeota archaeon]|nr:CPBP family intramembrane metalloprotease [Candidatus Micrarchaeota archaeon]
MKFILVALFSIIILVMSVIFYSEDYSLIVSGAALHLALLSIALHFLWQKNLKTTLKSLRFPGSIVKNLYISVIGLGTIFLTLLVLGLILTAGGMNDQQNVFDKILELPVFLLLFAVIAAPISEELFFRAMLVPRIGVIPSSLIFGFVHFSYGSVVEILGATAIGIILAVMYKKSKSITPCLLTHIIYNLLAISVVLLMP